MGAYNKNRRFERTCGFSFLRIRRGISPETMTRNWRLSHNLAVVSGHLEEVGNLHRTLFGLLRSPNRSGSAQTFKRVNQKCLHFYFRATCLELAQCPRKRGRSSRLASLSGESLRGSREICCLLWAFPTLS